MSSIEQLLALLGSEPQPANQLCRTLGVSQATLSRLITRAGGSVARLGQGRATRYCAIAENKQITPLFNIDERGFAHELAQLTPLRNNGFILEQQSNAPFWLLGEKGNGYFDNLPYFLDDLKPQGFLGRLIASSLSKIKPYPADPIHWKAQHIFSYLTEEANDLPGNLLLGERALNQHLNYTSAMVKSRILEYPQLALQILNDDVPDSSAGGEQQKFTAYTEDVGHVIVKFSSSTDSPEATRWRDLLISEHIALTLLNEHNIQSAMHKIHEYDGRVYLESQRFDRSGLRGRRPMLSLSAIDLEFVNNGSNWVNVASQLLKIGKLSPDDFQKIVFLQTFAQWISNTDMNLGNISLKSEQSSFVLLPVYDMLPMGFVIRQGEEIKKPFHAPVQTLVNRDVWNTCGQLAVDYWGKVIEDKRISKKFRKIAKKQRASILESLT